MNLLLQARGNGGIGIGSLELILILGVAIYVYLIYMVCKEAKNRKGANMLVAALLSLFITPICGILYLLLFPRNNS